MKCQSGCNRLYRSKEDMRKHCEASHNIYHCSNSKCAKKFSSTSARSDHERSHLAVSMTAPRAPPIPNGYIPCGIGTCQKSFPTAEGKNHHREVSHGIAKPAVKILGCNDCDKRFSSAEALRQHQQTSEGHTHLASAIGSSKCNNCSRNLRNQEALEQHFVADHSLIKIDSNRTQGAELIKRFRHDWLKPTIPVPTVICVYQIYNLGWRKRKFDEYRDRLPGDGNVVDRYHGTTVRCQLGAGISTKLCQDIKCGLCGIIRCGFKTAKATRNTWQRFGLGIYTTATSSKSNDYVRTSSTKRAVLCCKVVAGNVFRTWTNMPNLTGPPAGFDSVSGEVGEHLNYDETVVYKSKAVLPKFLIIYEVEQN